MNEQISTDDVAYSEIMASQLFMQTTYAKNGNEHLLVRAIVFTFPEDYEVSNEVFSSQAFRGLDPRSCMFVCPCDVTYLNGVEHIHEQYFRAIWRFNKHMKDALITTTAPNHQQVSLNNLNLSFSRMRATNR